VRFKQRRFFDETTLFLGLPAKVGSQQARQLYLNNYLGQSCTKTNKKHNRDESLRKKIGANFEFGAFVLKTEKNLVLLPALIVSLKIMFYSPQN